MGHAVNKIMKDITNRLLNPLKLFILDDDIFQIPGESGSEGSLRPGLGLSRSAHRDEGGQGRRQEAARGGEDQGHRQQVSDNDVTGFISD